VPWYAVIVEKQISADIKVQKQAPIITRNVNELVGILSKKADIWDHIQAIKDLSQIGGHIAELAIIKQLDTPQLPVRVNAAQALELIGSGKAIPPLQALATRNGVDSEAAKRAISKIKERCGF
jgi:HEAT repeat protein